LNKKYVLLHLLLVIFTGIVMLLADFLVLVIFGNLSPARYFNFGIASLVFLAIYYGFLLPNSKCFSYGYFKDLSWKELEVRLNKAGGIPIKSIGIAILLHIIFWVGIYLRDDFLAITTLNVKTLPLMAISFGMTVASFLYVICDGMITKVLLAHKLIEYPREYRKRIYNQLFIRYR